VGIRGDFGLLTELEREPSAERDEEVRIWRPADEDVPITGLGGEASSTRVIGCLLGGSIAKFQVRGIDVLAALKGAADDIESRENRVRRNLPFAVRCDRND
jgi:hypothetical protein